jgi:SET family sugar efflux transporter-like MFS transporter
MVALVAAALGFVGLCWVRDYRLLLFIGVAFLGAGGSAISLIFSFGRAAISARDEAERTFITATLRTLLSVAWVFGPPIGALILAAIGFSGLFLFAAASFTACAVVVGRIKEPVREPRQASAAPSEDALSLMEMTALSELSMPIAVTQPAAPATVQQLTIWRPVLALTLIGLAANATMIVLPLYMVLGLGGTRIEVSIMLGLGAFLEIPMMLVLGARGTMLNKPRWLAAAAAVHMLYFVAMAAAGHVWALIPMQALSAFVVAVTSCLGMTSPGPRGARPRRYFSMRRGWGLFCRGCCPVCWWAALVIRVLSWCVRAWRGRPYGYSGNRR